MFKDKRGTKKYNEAKSCAQGEKQIKEKHDATWIDGCGDHKARPYPAKLPTCKK